MTLNKIFMLCCLFLMVSPVVNAQEVTRQNAVSVTCGTIIEGEFTSDFVEHNYALNIDPGTALDVTVTPFGSGLSMGLFLTGPTNQILAMNGGNTDSRGISYLPVRNAPALTTEGLGSRGTHTIHITNFEVDYYDVSDDAYYYLSSDEAAGIGLYTLYIGCTLRDGTVINPGEIVDNIQPPQNTTSQVMTVTVQETIAQLVSDPDFFGFPGLAPVDMSAVARIPLSDGIPFTGAVTPTGGEILGYTISATTDQLINLTVERLSGNLNLGVAVIDADSNLLYFSALVTSEVMSTRLRMPADGEYIVGVFRLDLLSPDAPDATAFSIQIDSVE